MEEHSNQFFSPPVSFLEQCWENPGHISWCNSSMCCSVHISHMNHPFNFELLLQLFKIKSLGWVFFKAHGKNMLDLTSGICLSYVSVKLVRSGKCCPVIQETKKTNTFIKWTEMALWISTKFPFVVYTKFQHNQFSTHHNVLEQRLKWQWNLIFIALCRQKREKKVTFYSVNVHRNKSRSSFWQERPQ